jgi:hypothetical protein
MALGEMYQRWTLDCVVEAARTVSRDFAGRPLHYRRVVAENVKKLADLGSKTGHDPAWPDANQREVFYSALFGPSDGKPVSGDASRFHQSAAAVREAAIKYSEYSHDPGGPRPGEPILLQEFKQKLEHLRAYLDTLAGPAVDFCDGHCQSVFDAAANALRDPDVARAFGVFQAPQAANWPRETGKFDNDGASLVDEITRLLVPERTGRITQSLFLDMQHVASRGRATIEDALAYDAKWDDKQVRGLIGKAYSWDSALRKLAAAHQAARG